jgi:hypothetical protein
MVRIVITDDAHPAAITAMFTLKDAIALGTRLISLGAIGAAQDEGDAAASPLVTIDG